MVDEAKLSKPKIQDTADRVASYFVPCILALTVVVFSIWIAVGIAARDAAISDAIVNPITYALAALIVSCPCAIGLAVPTVMVIAGGVGAKHGVIFASPEAIESAGKASHLIVDMTGTLTQGRFEVVEEVYREDNHSKAMSMAKQLTSSSKVPSLAGSGDAPRVRKRLIGRRKRHACDLEWAKGARRQSPICGRCRRP